MGRRVQTALRSLAAASAAAAVLLATACTSPDPGSRQAAPHGQLRLLALGPVATWDPQRMTVPADMAVAGRLFLRTLTAFPSGPDVASQRRLVGDLATSTGTHDKHLKVWSFELRDGVRWQDGSPVTCQDVRYGISRSFAEPFASEGLNYPLAYLDIARKADGTSTYAGPFSGAGQKGFDTAVSCKSKTITFRLTQPTADFNQIVSLPAFAPVKKSQDQGRDAPHAVFSNGPYTLQGEWDASGGGSFVRNAEWDQVTDPLRRALPESIRYVEGVESQTAAQRVMADEAGDRNAVTLDSAPPAMQQRIVSDEPLRARSVNPRNAYVDYLAPNFASALMSKEPVRKALAIATSRHGYVNALGGRTSADAAYSLISPSLPGHRGTDPFGAGVSGNPAKARALLQDSELTLPVPVRVAYRSSPTSDKAMAALASGWEEAGFAVTLLPIARDYFSVISDPAQLKKTDVFWANWAPMLPTGSTVLPQLFDSRLNLSKVGTGRDYGSFHDARVNAEITRIGTIAAPDAGAQAWAALDAGLAKRGVFIALAQRRAVFIGGSAVTGLSANEALGGVVDLAGIGVG
jgi:peptide/nickel transport system substrate-binding protein